MTHGPPAAPQGWADGSTDARLTKWFAVVVLVLSTGAFFAVADPTPEGESRPVVLLLWAMAYVAAGVGVLDGLVRRRLWIPVPPTLVAFVAVALASVVWSVAPALTLRRSVGLVGTVIVGLLLAQRLRPVEILDAVRQAMLIVAVASLLLYLAGDPRAVDPLHETLRGVVATKNTLGRVMGLGLLAAVTVAFLERSRLRRCLLSSVPMVAALALAGSVGGTITAVVVLVLMGSAALWGATAGRIVLAGAAALTLAALAFALPATSAEDVAALVGRDATLTGRTEIWALSLDAAGERPVLGYGYGAFWDPDGAEAAARIAARLYWSVPNAHNGLLDLALELGVVGVALGAALMVSILVRGVRDARAGRRHSAVILLSIGTLFIASNVVESSFLDENAFLTVVTVAALAAREPVLPRRAERRRAIAS